MVPLYILGILLAGFILTVASDQVVKVTNTLAKTLRIKSFVVGFVLIGATTSLPEIFIASQAVRDGSVEIAVGNLLGGIILLTGIVFGLGAMALGKINLNHGLTKYDILFSSIILVSPAFVLWDGELTRGDGVLLFFLYCIQLIAFGEREHVVTVVEKRVSSLKHPLHLVAVLAISLVGIAVASRGVVVISEFIAHIVGIPELVFGLFIISIGTNLPEITLTIEAIIKKQRNIAYGSVLGSSVVNPAIMGMIGIFSPFTVGDLEKLRITLVFLFFAAGYFYWAASSRREITRKEGVGLFVMYLMFIAFEIIQF